MAILHPLRSPAQDLEALLALAGLGAHLVLCTANKRAVRRGWQLPDRAPTPEDVRQHVEGGGLCGLVPGSLGLVVFDADRGDAAQLRRRFPPLVAIATRPGRFHLVYTDSREWRPRDFWCCGAFGQVRSAGGFVLLHQPRQLLEALQSRRRDYPPPAGPELVVGPEARRLAVAAGLVAPRKSPRQGARQGRAKPKRRAASASVGGKRDSTAGLALFDAVRGWAYGQVQAARASGQPFEAWLLAVLERAEAEASAFVEPLPGRDVVDIAHSVARWTWERYNSEAPPATSGDVQRRRVLRRWHGDGSDRTVAWLWLRDSAVHRDRARGLSQRALAAKYGLSQSGIRVILGRAPGPFPE